MQRKYKIWDWFPAQTIQDWEDQYQRLLSDAILIPASERKNNKTLFYTIKEIEKFLRSKGKKFIYL
jgi:hypothetical protein